MVQLLTRQLPGQQLGLRRLTMGFLKYDNCLFN